jgi:hypothetical protein
MQHVPFQTVDQGLAREDVAEMLQAQMELARSQPEEALTRLAEVELRRDSPGLDPEEVGAWVEAQRDWLTRRIAAATPISAAVEAFASAADGLKRAVDLELHASEARISDREKATTASYQASLAAAQASLDASLSEARQLIRRDAKKIRRKALEDAERILDRAGREAARILMEAEGERRRAHARAEQSRSVQEELLASIDAAKASVSSDSRQRVA